MDGSKYRSKSYAMANAGKKLPYMFLLLLALTAGALSVVVLQKVREQRVFAGQLQERDRQLVSLRVLLQKEKAFNREMKRKVDEMKATVTSLRTQKTDQKSKLKGLEATVANLKKTQKELEAALTEKESRINKMEETTTDLKKAQKQLEAALTEKESHIKQMEEKATNATKTQKELEAGLREKDSRIRQMEEKATSTKPDQMAALMEILQRKEAELEEIKTKFQDFKKTDRVSANNTASSTPVQRVVNSTAASTHVQRNNASATPDNVVVKKPVNSSSVVTLAKSEEKKSANTTAVESRHPRDRSLEEKPVKVTTSMEEGGTQGNLNDFDEDIDIDDIYGESRSKKSPSPRRNKKVLTNNLNGIGQSRSSLDQDSERVRYNKLVEKGNTKVANETKKNITGTLEKISKERSKDAGHAASKKAVEEMAGAADVKPNINMPANNDEGKQQNRKQKKKRFKSKRKSTAESAAITAGEEVAKQKPPAAVSK